MRGCHKMALSFCNFAAELKNHTIMRKLTINKISGKTKNRQDKAAEVQKSSFVSNFYLPSYSENVFYGGREDLTHGKFHDMFMAGDGHELEDYTDSKGVFHLAHAKSIYSSSMLAYNFFHWISKEQPLVYHSITYDKVYFEVKIPVLARNTDDSPNHSPANMDVVLISDDCKTMFCIESKYTEHTHHCRAEFADAYFKHSCYYAGNPFVPSFFRMALRYNEKHNGYFAGIKQNVSHLIGLSNIKYDADALAWFKGNNPYIEAEVMEHIDSATDIFFTNLLYFHPDSCDAVFGNIKAVQKTYPYLLCELQFEHLQNGLDTEFLPYSIFNTYPEFFKEISSQMTTYLATYLDNRYVLTVPPHFPLPEGYDTADHYLTDVVMKGANERYKDSYTIEVTNRIKHELRIIRHRRLSDCFLIAWDCVSEAGRHGFCLSPGVNDNVGSVVSYCLGITDIEPISAGFDEAGLLYKAALPYIYLELSIAGEAWVKQYLSDKYGKEAATRIICKDFFIIDIVEDTLAAAGQNIDFHSLPFNTKEQIQFYISDETRMQYSYFKQEEIDKLRTMEVPAFDDMVRVFSEHTIKDGGNLIPREHCYARCMLFLRATWLKMHYPKEFQEAVEKRRPYETYDVYIDALHI